jgi:hypothetical protein
MAGSDLNGPGRPTGLDAVADYLSTVGARLTGPLAARTRIIDELRGGLTEALEVHLARGRSPREATAAAVAEFGDPRMVAVAFGPELAAVQARRVALGLTVAATGRLGRRLGGWLGRRATVPPTAAAVAGLAAVLADLTLLAIIGSQTLATPGSRVWAPVVVAAGASLVRAALAGSAARRCLATRAALT